LKEHKQHKLCFFIPSIKYDFLHKQIKVKQIRKTKWNMQQPSFQGLELYARQQNTLVGHSTRVMSCIP